MSRLDRYDDEQSPADALTSIFARSNGERNYYSDAEVREVLPVLVLLGGLNVRTLPPNLKQVMIEFAEQIPMSATLTAEGVITALDTYYSQRKINPELLGQIRDFLRGQLLRGQKASRQKLQAVSQLLASNLTEHQAPTLESLNPRQKTLLSPKRSLQRAFTIG